MRTLGGHATDKLVDNFSTWNGDLYGGFEEVRHKPILRGNAIHNEWQCGARLFPY